MNTIYKLMINSSDKSIRDLFEFLLEKSGTPYFQILKKWIFQGILDDPFQEFIVQENKNCSKDKIEKDFNDQYWTEKFTYREDMVPIFLAKYKEKVMHSGKYLNVMRECGKDVKYPYEQEGLLQGVLPRVSVDEEMKDDTVFREQQA